MTRKWDVEVSGLSEREARDLATRLSEAGTSASAVDPALWLTWRLDVESVRMLIGALRTAVDTTEDPVAQSGLQSLLEDCEFWLTMSGTTR